MSAAGWRSVAGWSFLGLAFLLGFLAGRLL